MPNETTIAELSDSTDEINQLGVVGTSGAVVRDRPNQAASVRVTDASGDTVDTPVFYTSRYHGDAWKRGGSQHSANHAHTTPDFIIPLPPIGLP